MSTALQKAKELVSTWMSVSLGLRIAVGTALGALGSSTLIGFLAELGAVNYALAYGARMPTEGVPYLRYAVTAMALAIFAIAFLIFFLLRLFLTDAVRQIKHSLDKEAGGAKGDLTTWPLKSFILRGAIPAMGATMGLFQIIAFWRPPMPSSFGISLLYHFLHRPWY